MGKSGLTKGPVSVKKAGVCRDEVTDMTPEEFQTVYPLVIAWVRQTVAAHTALRRTGCGCWIGRCEQSDGWLCLSNRNMAIGCHSMHALGPERFVRTYEKK